MAEVHRLSVVDFVPSAINNIAFHQSFSELGEPLPKSADTDVRFALSRQDGTIELWNATQDFVHEQSIQGGENISVEALVWQNNRLFTAGVHSTITEWDAEHCAPKAQESSYGGPVWALAMNRTTTLLMAGCEDGCVRAFDVSGGNLALAFSFDKQKGRVLSLAWTMKNHLICSGDDQGMIRVWDTKTRRCQHYMTLQDRSAKKKVMVWAIVPVSADVVASADSTGNVQFWNTELGTLMQRVSTHSSAVLTLALEPSSGALYAAGMDAAMVKLNFVQDQSKWVIEASHREHSHDIRALSVSPDGNFLVSGGVDTQLGISRTESFAPLSCSTRKIPSFPQMSPICSSLTSPAGSPLVAYKHGRAIDIWCLMTPGTLVRSTRAPLSLQEDVDVEHGDVDGDGDVDVDENGTDVVRAVQGGQLLLQIQLNSVCNINDIAISSDEAC
eukprot:m.115842 g.115842  ORF g.115842 m.115842 type:complete len:443 (-) comp13582_c0_seq2:1633-2961(-)